jgi:hypothetical protein
MKWYYYHNTILVLSSANAWIRSLFVQSEWNWPLDLVKGLQKRRNSSGMSMRDRVFDNSQNWRVQGPALEGVDESAATECSKLSATIRV